MVLVAAIFGIIFGLLARVGWNWTYHRWHDVDARDAEHTRDGLLQLAFMLAVSIYLAALIAVLDAARTYYWSENPNIVVRFINFMAVPTHFGVVLAFVGGILLVWCWEKIRNFLVAFHLMPPRPLDRPAEEPMAQRPADAETESARIVTAVSDVVANKEPYPWLTRIVGIAAVTLVALVAILAFFPGLLTHIESIKVAGVEARFATSASQTVRINRQTQVGKEETNHILVGWQYADSLIKNYSIPAQIAVAKLGGEDRTEASFGNLNLAREFLRRYATPIAEAMSCYSSDFVFVHSKFQRSLADLANNWARLAYQAAIYNVQAKPEIDKPTNAELQIQFQEIAKESDVLAASISRDLKVRHSRCGITSTERPYEFDENKPFAANAELAVKLHRIFSNGYVVAFIGDMLLLTHDPEHVIPFLEDMRPYLDDSVENLTGRINYYYKTAAARDHYDYWKSRDANEELSKAKALVDIIIAAYSKSPDDTKSCGRPGKKLSGDEEVRLRPYYCGLRMFITSLQASNNIRDWLEGRTIAPLEAERLKDWNKEMQSWLAIVSVAEMDAYDSGWPQWIANVYDTLAMSELALSSIENDVSAVRCIRVANLLLKSKYAWDEIRALRTALPTMTGDAPLVHDAENARKKFDRGTYQVALNLYDAHKDLLRGVCPTPK